MATRTKTATIDLGAVARRAYDRYASRGFTDGHDQGDWFAAEAEVRAEVAYDRALRPAGKPAPKPAVNAKTTRGKTSKK